MSHLVVFLEKICCIVGGGLVRAELEPFSPIEGGGFLGERALWTVTFLGGAMNATLAIPAN